MSFINRWLIIAFLFFVALTVGVYQLYLGCDKYPDWNLCFFDNNILASFFASALEDIIFFGSVGFIIFLASFPNKHDVETRLSYLYKKRGVSKKILDAVMDGAKNLGVCAKTASVVYTIEEYNEEYNAFKVMVKIDTELLNLISGAAYENSRYVNMVFDPIEKMGDNPVYGKLTDVQYLIDGDLKQDSRMKFPVAFTSLEDGFFIREKVSKNNKHCTRVQLSYWLWVIQGEEFWYKPYRNTDSFTLELVNKLDIPLNITCLGDEVSKKKTIKALKKSGNKGDSLTLYDNILMKSSDRRVILLEKK